MFRIGGGGGEGSQEKKKPWISEQAQWYCNRELPRRIPARVKLAAFSSSSPPSPDASPSPTHMHSQQKTAGGEVGDVTEQGAGVKSAFQKPLHCQLSSFPSASELAPPLLCVQGQTEHRLRVKSPVPG